MTPDIKMFHLLAILHSCRERKHRGSTVGCPLGWSQGPWERVTAWASKWSPCTLLIFHYILLKPCTGYQIAPQQYLQSFLQKECTSGGVWTLCCSGVLFLRVLSSPVCWFCNTPANCCYVLWSFIIVSLTFSFTNLPIMARSYFSHKYIVGDSAPGALSAPRPS